MVFQPGDNVKQKAPRRRLADWCVETAPRRAERSGIFCRPSRPDLPLSCFHKVISFPMRLFIAFGRSHSFSRHRREKELPLPPALNRNSRKCFMGPVLYPGCGVISAIIDPYASTAFHRLSTFRRAAGKTRLRSSMHPTPSGSTSIENASGINDVETDHLSGIIA